MRSRLYLVRLHLLNIYLSGNIVLGGGVSLLFSSGWQNETMIEKKRKKCFMQNK